MKKIYIVPTIQVVQLPPHVMTELSDNVYGPIVTEDTPEYVWDEDGGQ